MTQFALKLTFTLGLLLLTSSSLASASNGHLRVNHHGIPKRSLTVGSLSVGGEEYVDTEASSTSVSLKHQQAETVTPVVSTTTTRTEASPRVKTTTTGVTTGPTTTRTTGQTVVSSGSTVRTGTVTTGSVDTTRRGERVKTIEYVDDVEYVQHPVEIYAPVGVEYVTEEVHTKRPVEHWTYKEFEQPKETIINTVQTEYVAVPVEVEKIVEVHDIEYIEVPVPVEVVRTEVVEVPVEVEVPVFVEPLQVQPVQLEQEIETTERRVILP